MCELKHDVLDGPIHSCSRCINIKMKHRSIAYYQNVELSGV